MTELFRYHPDVMERYPTVRAGVVHVTGLDGGPSSAELMNRYLAEQGAVKIRLGAQPIAELPSVAAWRRAFSSFGAKPTRYRNAAEALLRRLSKAGDIPTVNNLVDMANLVSIRYALPVAAFDRDGIRGGITVRLATGEETFTDLGSDRVSNPEPGEVVFVDQDGVVAARRWCWRQSVQSATRPSTTDALIVMEGLHAEAERDVQAATSDLVSLLGEHQPKAGVERGLVSPGSPDA